MSLVFKINIINNKKDKSFIEKVLLINNNV